MFRLKASDECRTQAESLFCRAPASPPPPRRVAIPLAMQDRFTAAFTANFADDFAHALDEARHEDGAAHKA